jgi:hypothetical protein
VLFVLLAWHLPITYHGVVSTHRLPGVPWNLHRCHDIACLFDQAPTARHHYYLQVRTAERPDWTTVDVDEYFPMQPFGHRSRFERLLGHWGDRPKRAHRELAAWLFARHRERHPEQSRWLELRFLWTWVNITEDPPPQGAARPPPAESFAYDRRRVLSVHRPESP